MRGSAPYWGADAAASELRAANLFRAGSMLHGQGQPRVRALSTAKRTSGGSQVHLLMKQGFPLALGGGAVKRPGRIIAVLIEPTGRRDP